MPAGRLSQCCEESEEVQNYLCLASICRLFYPHLSLSLLVLLGHLDELVTVTDHSLSYERGEY